MKPGRPFLLLTGVALLGAIASFNEMTPDAQASLLDGTGETTQSPLQSAVAPYHSVTDKMAEAHAKERPAGVPAPPQTDGREGGEVPSQPVKPPELERPAVSLIGTVIGNDVQIGVFLETATKDVFRLRVGEDHQGWMMRLIKAREVTLIKNRNVVVLELRPSGGSPAPDGPTMPPPVPDGVPGVATGPIVSTANYADEQPNIR